MEKELSINAPIPFHEKVDKFVVNGVTVYTLPNTRPDDAIEMRLLVNTGSLMENEEQQGLAHFIEHLGFKGTESYERYELVKMLESLGISYGPDLNASTHLLETSYKLSIRADAEFAQFRIAVHIFHQWAFHMNLSDDDIHEEKNVIMSEYVAKQGLGARLLAKYWSSVFDNNEDDRSCLVARRMPIGIPQVFMQASRAQIRSFYKHWYRPDNIAILIVGSISDRQDEVRQIVTDIFSATPSQVLNDAELDPSTVSAAPATISEPNIDRSADCDQIFLSNVKEITKQHLVLPRHHMRDVTIHMSDRELTSAQISFEFFSPIVLSTSISFVKDNVLHRLMASLIDKRLNEIIKRRSPLPDDVVSLPSGESPFLSVGLSIREFVRGLRCVALSATLNMMTSPPLGDDEAKASGGELADENTKRSDTTTEQWRDVVSSALRALMTETRRVREWGVHVDELKAAKAKWAQLFEDQRDRETTTSSALASDLTSYVLNGGQTVFATPSVEASLCLEVMEGITISEMNQFLAKSLDMDLPEEDSRYYGHNSVVDGQASPIRGMFRALSGQFPGTLCPQFDLSEGDEELRSLLIDSRNTVAAASHVEEWPAPDVVHEDVVLHAAQMALGIALTQSPDVFSGSPSKEKRGLSLDVLDEYSIGDASGLGFRSNLSMCRCCSQSFSFLPVEMVDGNVYEKKNKSKKHNSVVTVSEEEKLNDCDDQPDHNDVIVNEMSEIDSHEFRLPNGLKVCVKWMREENPGKVSFQGFALGGSTELTESEDAVMSFLDTMASHSSMRVSPSTLSKSSASLFEGGDKEIVLNAKDIAEIQSVAKVGVNTQRHFNHRGIGGSAPTSKFELLLAFLALKLTSQCIDDKAFDDLVKQQKNFLLYRNNSPEQQFMERARILSCGDIHISRPLTEEVLTSCTVEMARRLYTKAFMVDPTEFTFVLIGDLPPMSEVKRLLSLYLGPLRPMSPLKVAALGGKWREDEVVSMGVGGVRSDITTQEKELYPFTRFGKSFEITKPVQETICLRQADNASTLMVFRVQLREEESPIAEHSDLENTIALEAACKNLQSTLLDELRIRLGKVYSVAVDFSRGSLSHVALVTVSLLCDPLHLPQVRMSIEQQLANLQSIGPDPANLVGIVETMCSKHKQSLKSPSHWMFWLLDSYKSHSVYAWLASRSHTRNEDSISPIPETNMMCSAKWVERFARMRSTQKLDLIRKVVNDAVIRDIYRQYFDISRSVHLHLCPLVNSDDQGKQSQT